MESLKKAVEDLNASFEIVHRYYDSLKNEQGNLLFIFLHKIYNLETFFSKRSKTDYVTTMNEECRNNMSKALSFTHESLSIMKRAINAWEYNIPTG